MQIVSLPGKGSKGSVTPCRGAFPGHYVLCVAKVVLRERSDMLTKQQKTEIVAELKEKLEAKVNRK